MRNNYAYLHYICKILIPNVLTHMKHIANYLSWIVASVLAATCCPAISAQISNDEGMLTPGRTWWYNSRVTGNSGQYEFGVRIGDEIEIEGNTWKKIEVIKQAFNGQYFSCDDWKLRNDIQDTGYIRLDEDSNVIVRFSKRNYAEGESCSDVIIALAGDNILEGRNMMGLTFDIGGGEEIVIYSLDESKTNFTFGIPNAERTDRETALDFTIKSVGAFDGGMIPDTQLFTCEQSFADMGDVKFEYSSYKLS